MSIQQKLISHAVDKHREVRQESGEKKTRKKHTHKYFNHIKISLYKQEVV